ncbi:heterokaryon incompatibility protein-domain-containing protein [Tricladium varicosporioides]|nr:heterokaryon incompatibility protein-domain-containing protein [Hymenoscyphus varicosporioides]
MKVTRNWLRDCLENHINCPKPTATYFPSRILNVGLDSQLVHLESHVFQGSKPYVTLSHCWGSGDILKTTSRNFNQMKNGIQISSLSDSFLNAVSITRALGFTYLWIDSLCILQDSIEDWSFQASQMHKVYSNSSLTICITSSEKTKPKQPQISFNTNAISGPVSSCSACANDYRIFHPLLTTSMATMFLDSPWWRRAWVMQEVLLSSRVLYWSSSGVAWECGSTTSSAKAITSRLRKHLKLLAKQIAPGESQSLTNASRIRKYASNFQKSWKTIVEEYSKREMTYHQDKLPALAGVAAKFAEVSGQIYAAGLWTENLIQSLLWCRSFASAPLARPAYRAPSWSWASIDGPITWHKSVIDLPDVPGTAILDCSTTPKSPNFLYGGVSDGYLEIRGMLRHGIVSVTKSQEVLDISTRKQFAFARWDTLDSLERYRPMSSPKHGIVEGIWCLEIRKGAGLILREISELRYERVGMFWVSERDTSNILKKPCWELKTFTII